ncbi:MAG: hypothetical protein R2860_10205 [Desulfobacterales bacterium]
MIDFVDHALDFQPMLIGGPSQLEKNHADAICGLCRKPPVIALEKAIRTTLLQIGGCRLIVAPDTAPCIWRVAGCPDHRSLRILKPPVMRAVPQISLTC